LAQIRPVIVRIAGEVRHLELATADALDVTQSRPHEVQTPTFLPDSTAARP